jgi:hypothetical protein
MKVAYFLLLFVLFAGQAFGVTGTQQEYGQTKELSDLPGMSTEGTKYMIGVHVVDGVKGVAYLNDVREKMATYGLKQTHHIMAAFEDVSSGEALESGSVAVKVKAPNENINEAIKLFGMEGSFGADITLDKKGMYQFEIGTVLSDGNKRKFILNFENN